MTRNRALTSHASCATSSAGRPRRPDTGVTQTVPTLTRSPPRSFPYRTRTHSPSMNFLRPSLFHLPPQLPIVRTGTPTAEEALAVARSARTRAAVYSPRHLQASERLFSNLPPRRSLKSKPTLAIFAVVQNAKEQRPPGRVTSRSYFTSILCFSSFISSLYTECLIPHRFVRALCICLSHTFQSQFLLEPLYCIHEGLLLAELDLRYAEIPANGKSVYTSGEVCAFIVLGFRFSASQDFVSEFLTFRRIRLVDLCGTTSARTIPSKE